MIGNLAEYFEAEEHWELLTQTIQNYSRHRTSNSVYNNMCTLMKITFYEHNRL